MTTSQSIFLYPIPSDARSKGEDGLASAAAAFHRRPFDSELAGSTLWPEKEKVFGHGYEASRASLISYLI